MIKIVEIKGGLKEYHEQKEFSFEHKDFYFGKSRRKGFSGLYEQLVFPQRVTSITREELEEAMSQVSPMTPTRSRDMVVHSSAEGYRQFQEALQEEASRQLDALNVVLETERNPLRNTIVFGTGGEVTDSRGQVMGNNYTVSFDPVLDSTSIAQTNFISDPITGNTEVRHNGQDFIFSRDMTEEQIIAYFDSLN